VRAALIVIAYEQCVLDCVAERSDSSVAPSWYEGEVSSVLNGLMARQATLTTALARNLGIWNGHVSPLILRSMVEVVIMFRWILKDPKQRSQEYIGYGLGQAKLSISHLEKKAQDGPDEEAPLRMAGYKHDWIDSQRLMPFVEVNLGSWSGTSVRKMAIESGDEDLYNFAFTPFSACVHSQWDHVHIFNTSRCENPLHKWHRVPSINDDGFSSDYVYRSAKYLDLTLASFDDAAGVKRSDSTLRDFVTDKIESIFIDDAQADER
jgi:hypothetical protein